MEGNKMRSNFFLICRWLPIALVFGLIHCALASPQVLVEIDGPVRLDGQLQVRIHENGSNEIGDYKRTLVFTATAHRGAILISSIKGYKATTTFPNGRFWRTSNVPVGGFIYLYLKDNKQPFVNIALLEYTDGLPAPMSLNGVHAAQFSLPAKLEGVSPLKKADPISR